MLGGWTRTDSRKSAWKTTQLVQDHLKDEGIVGNLPLRKRRRGSVRVDRSTDLQGDEEEEFRVPILSYIIIVKYFCLKKIRAMIRT